MASGSYARKQTPQEPAQSVPTQSRVPQRATRQLPAVMVEEEELQESQLDALRIKMNEALDKVRSIARTPIPLHFTASSVSSIPAKNSRVVDEYAPHPLARHKVWMNSLIICIVAAVIFSIVLLSSSMVQREGDAQLVNLFGGKVYDVQVGGTLAAQVQQSDGPVQPKVALSSGPYNVLGQPTINADFINQVLAAYNSPAVGKGQALYDLGVKYGIDPAFALAFFQHESTFGKFGEAKSSLSLGNLRCIPTADCRDNYAWFPSWEAGFEAWYKLIRNLYVAVWGLNTVDQIIPRYAPTSDNNNEAAYIASLKHSIDTWHSGQLIA